MMTCDKEQCCISHEESNSRMFYVLSFISGPSIVINWTDATDSFMVVLGCRHLDLHIYMIKTFFC